MPRDDAFGEFRELLLLQQAPFRAMLGAGALGLLPFTVAAAIVMAVAPHHYPDWFVAAALVYGGLAGAITALAYRRGHIPYRRGDVAAAAALTVAFTPAVLLAARATGTDIAVGVAVLVSVLPALAVEVAWRPLFALALRHLAGLNLDLLVHESLREHYGDNWQTYMSRIRADLREARRLRDLAESAPSAKEQP
jgi:hypothetical protein